MENVLDSSLVKETFFLEKAIPLRQENDLSSGIS